MQLTARQFRLSTLLLVVTVTALGLALFLSLRQGRKLAAENRELSKLLGRPVVVDPHRIALGEDVSHPLIYLPTLNRVFEGYRFRIYRPPGRKLVLRCAFEESSGIFHQNGERIDLSVVPGDELTIDVVVNFDQDNNVLVVNSAASSTNAGHSTTAAHTFTPEADHWIFSDAYIVTPSFN